MTDTQPTMNDLYPDGRGYHQAHEPYIRAVAATLDGAGLYTASWHAEPNYPRDGFIELDMNRQGVIDDHALWPYDEVGVAWIENQGWFLVCEQIQGRASRYVFNLNLERVVSPAAVAIAVGEKAGLTLEVDDDGHPDLDFPGHSFEDDNIPLELALRHYAE